jgi:hypothetical protein
MQILIITLVFDIKPPFYSQKISKNRRKLAKIAENCDHNIDPDFAPILA